MQATSATWKALWAAGAALETAVVIDGTTYTPATAPVIQRGAMRDDLGVGNVVSASCSFTLRTSATIPKAASVQVKMRLTDGTNSSEWLPAGTFFIGRRSYDPIMGLLTLTCYDALLKANAVFDVPFVLATGDGEIIVTGDGYAIALGIADPVYNQAELTEALAEVIGVEIDARTQIDSSLTMSAPPAGATYRDALGVIAEANGGNWIITPENKLRLVPLLDAADAEEAEEDVVDVDGIVGSVQASAAVTISGVSYTNDSGTTVIIGNEAGVVLPTTLSAELAQALASQVVGNTAQGYYLTGAVYDPAAEIGDYLRAAGGVSSALYTETATLGPAFRGDVSAPQSAEVTDEYPYIGESSKALAEAKAYALTEAQRVYDQLDSSLDQEGVFNRLTDNGAAQGIYLINGQLYVNMSYARAGTLILGGLNNQNGLLQVQDADGNVIGEWNNGGITLNNGRISSANGNNYWALNGEAPQIVVQQGTIGSFTLSNGTLHCTNTIDSASVSVDISKSGISMESDGSVGLVKTVLTPGSLTWYVRGNSFASFYCVPATTATFKLRIGNTDLIDFANLLGVIVNSALYVDTGDDVKTVRTSGALSWYANGSEYASFYYVPAPSPMASPTLKLKINNTDLIDFANLLGVKVNTGLTVTGDVSCGNGATGEFATTDGKVVTVTNGIITAITDNGAPFALTIGT